MTFSDLTPNLSKEKIEAIGMARRLDSLARATRGILSSAYRARCSRVWQSIVAGEADARPMDRGPKALAGESGDAAGSAAHERVDAVLHASDAQPDRRSAVRDRTGDQASQPVSRLRLFLRNLLLGAVMLAVVGGFIGFEVVGILFLWTGQNPVHAYELMAVGAVWFLIGFALTETFV
jgi:hypothetical protein